MSEEYFPEVVTLCGSTKFKKQYEEVAQKLTLKGKIILSTVIFSHSDNIPLKDETKKMLDELHFRKIDISDSIFVVDVKGYIGESTSNEIKYTKNLGKKIYYYSKGDHE